MMDGFDADGFHAPHKEDGREAPALKAEAESTGPTEQVDIGQLQGCGLQEQLWNTYNNGVSVVNGTLDATPPRRDPLDRRSGNGAIRFHPPQRRRRCCGGWGAITLYLRHIRVAWRPRPNPHIVMRGLDPRIHAVTARQVEGPVEWAAGSSPAATIGSGLPPPRPYHTRRRFAGRANRDTRGSGEARPNAQAPSCLIIRPGDAMYRLHGARMPGAHCIAAHASATPHM